MALMDMFKPAPAKTAGVATPVVPVTGPEGNKTPVVDTNKETQNVNKPEVQKNPLDVYTDVFNNANKGKEVTAPSFKLDPKIINDVAGKLDFTKGINPELLAKAQTGDVASLMEIISAVGRNAYSTSIEHLTTLTDTHLASRSEYESSRINDGVKTHLRSQALADAPNYSHPVVKQELNRIADQFSRSPEFADSTPQQIAEAAKNYLNDLHSALNPVDPTKDTKGNKKVEVMDWDKYLNL